MDNMGGGVLSANAKNLSLSDTLADALVKSGENNSFSIAIIDARQSERRAMASSWNAIHPQHTPIPT
jgi:hypothetical protein